MATVANAVTLPERSFDEYYATMASWLRPNNTDAYADYDVVSDDAATARSLAFSFAGQSGMVMTAEITAVAAFTGATGFDLHLYSSEPTGFADNAAFVPSALDPSLHIGMIPFADANKRTWGTGTLWVPTLTAPLPFVTTTNALYGHLVVRGTPTPAALALFIVKLGLRRTSPMGRR